MFIAPLLLFILLAVLFPRFTRLIMTLCAFGVLFVVASCIDHAHAKDNGIKVGLPGQGTYSIGPTQDHPFGRLTFASAGGYSQYAMETDTGLISFVGGKDFQPSATDYILEISGVLNVNPNMQVNKLPARGQCVMKQSADGNVVYSVVCHAETEIGDASMSFTGDGGKVTITRGAGPSRKK